MKNLRTDPMWDELKYKLTHPETEEDQRAREIKEKSYRESMLKRIFGDNEDGTITGAAAPLGTQEHWDKNGMVYWGDSNGNRLPDTKNYVEKFTNKAKAIASNVSDFINETNPNHPSYKQKTNVLVSSAMLPYMPETMLSKAVASKLAPNAGRKIAQSIAQGINGGAISGAFEGTIRSIQEQKNPIKTIAQDSALGAIGGAVGGSAGSNIQKFIRGRQLKYIEDLKALRKAETNFYKDYIQHKPAKHPVLGKIDMTQAGLETVSKQPQLGRNFPTLYKDIKQSNYVGYEEPYHKKHGTKDNIRGFHKLKNQNQEFLIADTDDGLKYYLSKKLGELDGRPSRVDSNSPTNIITNNVPKLKSFSEWIEELRQKLGD